MRFAAVLVAIWTTMAATALAQTIEAASYGQPTGRYAHGVLGDAIEWGELVLDLSTGSSQALVLPDERVFEDTYPRLHDVDGDGQPEVVVVESHINQGARLAIYGINGLIAATPYIGRSNRWLAPVAVGDLDGDGRVELAYIDRPHLAKTLRVWRFENGALAERASLRGLTNHRIGQDFISGGLRQCGPGPEMIVASGDWRRMVAVRFDGQALSGRDIGPFSGRTGFAEALRCD